MANEIIKNENDAVDEKEYAAAMNEAQNAPGTVTVKLAKPQMYNGEEYSELTFDFESLTGDDALNISDELTASGKTVVMPALSEQYLIRVAARACTAPVGADIFRGMPLKNYLRIVGAARNFLLAAE